MSWSIIATVRKPISLFKKHEEVSTPNGIKYVRYYSWNIPTTTKHLTTQVLNHGSEKRQFVNRNGTCVVDCYNCILIE